MTKMNRKVLDQWEREHKKEILAVKELGDQIGYGNMMSIASALWGLSLKDFGAPTTGAFIPTIVYDMKKNEGKKAVEELHRRMESFKRILKK